MTRKEFIKLIESIGFEYIGLYEYKEFKIYLYDEHYTFYIGSVFEDYVPLNDLELIEKNFKKELRNIKLKRILE